MLFCPLSLQIQCADGYGQAAILCYVGLELALLVLAARGSFHSLFLASSALKLVSALLAILLSVLDHSRSPRPSVLLNIYLPLTLLLDAAQARTLFLSSGENSEFTYSATFTAAVAVKAGVLLLEARQKSRWVTWDAKKHSPEETSGVLSLSVFFWLNKLFLTGYRKVLTLGDLFPLDSAFDATLLHNRFSANMDYSKLKGDKFGLAKVLVRTLKVPILLPIIPRLGTYLDSYFPFSAVSYRCRHDSRVASGADLIKNGLCLVEYTLGAAPEICIYPMTSLLHREFC